MTQCRVYDHAACELIREDVKLDVASASRQDSVSAAVDKGDSCETGERPSSLQVRQVFRFFACAQLWIRSFIGSRPWIASHYIPANAAGAMRPLNIRTVYSNQATIYFLFLYEELYWPLSGNAQRV
jgi:hypothetical protein